ncbi:MAG: class I SAM-dependent methyltransferase [Planctomycetota bacterium]
MPEAPLPPHIAFPTGETGPACPACAHPTTAVVYRLAGIPIHSCVLLGSREAACAFPTSDLDLCHCPTCGFLFNGRFDPACMDYSEDYEETQGYSGTFRTFLGETVARLAPHLAGEQRPVLEIGAGRGDFLAALCAASGTAGIGVDPSRTAGRVDLDSGAGLRFRHEEYGPKFFDQPVSALISRHTLEHLPQVAREAHCMGEHLRRNPGAFAFLELPDTLRILREGAFWDVYYEHCSYFTAHSLRGLFERAGFAIHDLRLVYGGQYLHLWAAPAHAPVHASLESDPATEAVAHFAASCRQALSHWHHWLAGSAPGSVVLWGSGSKATAFLSAAGSHDRIAAVVDINPDKHGKFVAGSGHEIVAPNRLRDLRPARVLIMNPIYRKEITADLAAMGLHPEIQALGE